MAFDTTTVAFEKLTGTGVYCRELVEAYESIFPNDIVYHTYRLARAIKGKKHLLPVRGKNIRNRYLQDPWTYLRGRDFDIFHGLNARLPFLRACKKIVTIHDLFSIFGKFSDSAFLGDQEKKIRQALQRAQHIIVPAHFTKSLLIERLGVPAWQISTVPEGVSSIYLQDFDPETDKEKLKEKFGIQKPFFLFVGTLEKRKNIHGILESFSIFDQGSPNSHNLVFIGGCGFGWDYIQEKIIKLNLKHRILLTGHLDREWLARFYRVAQAFLFLSWEEGYGIPVIEAMACGTPVISSNTTSLPEVGCGHSFLVAPDDHQMTAHHMGLAASHKIPKTKLILAQKYARALTWENAAKCTRDTYLELLPDLPV